MTTKRDTTYDSDDQGGEPPCFMCLLDEDGLLPDRRDTARTHPHAQSDGSMDAFGTGAMSLDGDRESKRFAS